jgi:putative oxidoreductase
MTSAVGGFGCENSCDERNENMSTVKFSEKEIRFLNYMRVGRLATTSAQWFLRLSIAGGFLSSVADRLGIWGAPGTPNIAWGAWAPFVEYAAKLNWFAPAPIVSFLAWAATFAEIVFAVGLIVGWQLRWFAFGSGLLLLCFALAMTLALGIKAPLNYSVFAASAGAFFLASSTWWQTKWPSLTSK